MGEMQSNTYSEVSTVFPLVNHTVRFEKCHLFFSGRLHFLDKGSSFRELGSHTYYPTCRIQIVYDYCTLHRNDSNLYDMCCWYLRHSL
jgi:hypothetical protein